MKTTSTFLILSLFVFVFCSFTSNDKTNVKTDYQDVLTIKFRPTDPKVNESILFSASYQSEAFYTWDFGDGSDKIHSAGSAISHTYSKTGTYKVTVRRSDGDLATDMVMISH